jgi:hypothetical protein
VIALLIEERAAFVKTGASHDVDTKEGASFVALF